MRKPKIVDIPIKVDMSARGVDCLLEYMTELMNFIQENCDHKSGCSKEIKGLRTGSMGNCDCGFIQRIEKLIYG